MTTNYEARLCPGIPTDCCDYGVISHASGKEVCRVWDEEYARKIADLLNAPPTGEGDMREAVARLVDPAAFEAGPVVRDEYGIHNAHPREMQAASAKADAILALPPIDARVEAIEDPWQPIETATRENGARMILAWDDLPGLSPHWEVGRWSSIMGWVNTYGRSFTGEPTHWMIPDMPLSPSPVPSGDDKTRGGGK